MERDDILILLFTLIIVGICIYAMVYDDLNRP